MDLASGTREVLLSLEPRESAAGVARRALRQAGLHEDVQHTVELLVTELIANALRHGVGGRDERLLLFGRVGDDFARVEVADAGAGFDPDTVTTGMGLRLLQTLAARWGCERRARGFRVWFEVDRRPEGRFSRGSALRDPV